MKIIQVSAYYPPHLGGQEHAVQDLSQYLHAAGHDVHVLTSTEGTGGVESRSVSRGVRVQRMRSTVFGHAPIMPGFAAALFKIARRDSIVHIHIGQAFTPEMVWLVSKLRHFRYVAELHIDFEPSGPAGVLLPLYKRLVLKRVMQSAAAVIVLNRKTLRLVDKMYNVGHKARIMNNGIDEAYFLAVRRPWAKQPPKRLRLLFVGRLSKQKNLNMLLHALAMTDRDIHLDVIGEGDQRKAIVQTIKKLKLTNVTLHGRLKRHQVIPFYETCDALVMPSLYEAQPLVLLEAKAARIPIIGTNVIGVAEHIWEAGIIVEPNPVSMAAGFEKFYKQYDALPGMVAAGYTQAEALRWCNLGKEYVALYESELAREA